MMRHQTISGRLKSLPGSRRVSAIISTEVIDRAGDIVRSQGCDKSGFMASGTVLWNHDQDQPIARCVSVTIGANAISATCEFPAPGVNAKADEIYGLIKAGVINATSIGFLPVDTKPRGGGRVDVLKWTLLEWSFVSDLARCTPRILEDDGAGNKTPVVDHPLVALFRKPNRAQTWFEFCEQMHMAYLLRSNAYAVILRNWHGDPVELIPVNPDLVTPMEAPDGSVYYTVTRAGMWLAACLENEPISIPAADVLHVRDLTFNTLVGVSRIALARDAIGLATVQEQQASRWAGNGARPAGVWSQRRLSRRKPPRG